MNNHPMYTQPVSHSGIFPADATPEYCVAAWLDLMRAGDKLLRAGLRMEIGPDGDLEAAYRRWYADRCDEHTKTLIRMLSELSRREVRHAG